MKLPGSTTLSTRMIISHVQINFVYHCFKGASIEDVVTKVRTFREGGGSVESAYSFQCSLFKRGEDI